MTASDYTHLFGYLNPYYRSAYNIPKRIKENNAERLKGVMLDAVIAYGDLGNSGNKVINLVDSKLYTKNSKCVEIDENLNQIFIDLVLEHLQSLWIMI